MSEIKRKELTDEDKIRLQLIDNAISHIKTMSKIGLERSEHLMPANGVGETIDDTSKPKENATQIENETVQVTPEQLILTEQKINKYKSQYNKENEDDIEIVLEEPLMRSHSCIGKSYKKKDLIRVMDVLIKNVSLSVIDNVHYNSIEKLNRVNKDFVRLSDVPTSEISKDDF
ncbi:MAG: hypothetical protein EZS28_045590 [Streblomastix strix]|uniref:Uncharacterized protein n=1 Tax=Streblomastix strix TaxID=222440 RepID=A0A5J4TKJ8_9EUKA|nr:MAG: hypothetical protein EZS28_045590 [Streblomastix strix]